MSDFRRWMRAVLPPLWVIVTALSISYGTRALLELLIWRYPSGSHASFVQIMLEAEAIQKFFTVVQCFVAGVYGIWRALGRHPVVRRRYREWLLQTPWRWPDPLPVGPALPAWQDIVVLAVLTVPSIPSPALTPFAPLLSAIIAYGVAALLASLNRPPGIAFFTGLWALAAVVYLRATPLAFVIAAAVLLTAACRATVISIREIDESADWLAGGWWKPPAIMQHGDLGWPIGALAPYPLRKFSTGLLLAIAVTAGLAVAAGHPDPINDPNEFEVGPSVVITAASLAFVRIFLYSVLANPKLNLARRFRYGRLITPRADSLVLSSLTILLAGYFLSSIVQQLPTTGMNQIALAVSILIVFAFSLPPSRETWRLTGLARVHRPPNRSGALYRPKHSPT